MQQRAVISTLVILLLAVGVTGYGFASDPHSQAHTWRLADSRNIEPEFIERFLAAYPAYDRGQSADPRLDGGFRTFSLSPDGSTVIALGTVTATEQDELVCRYGLDSGEVMCKVIEPGEAAFHPQLEQMSWSPDGTQIAMHENVFIYMMESDIWLLDVATLTFTNVTNDGVYGSFINKEPGSFQLDYTPLWNDDLYFFRSVEGKETWSVELYRFPKGSTEPERVFDLGVGMASFTVENQAFAAMSPDGTHMVVAPVSNEPPMTPGIWVIDLAAKKMTRLISIQDLQVAVPSWVGRENYQDGIAVLIQEITWAADGQTVIAKTFNPYITAGWWSVNYLAVDVRDGTVTSLADYEPFGSDQGLVQAVLNEPYFAPPGVGIIAPDGGSLFYVSAQAMQQPNRFIYAAPVPFGAEPVSIGALSDEDLIQTMLVDPRISRHISVYHAAADGRVLVGTVLLTFE
jgi:hypothetical protein